MKRLLLIAPALLALAGCVYEPGYVRHDGYYSGRAHVYYSNGYYAPRYYGYRHYDAWCCGPSVSVSYSRVHYSDRGRHYDRRHRGDGRRHHRH